MRKKGKITTWNDDKGFGFIAPFDVEKQVFIHVKAFTSRDRRPVVGDVVTYTLAKDDQGRIRAAKATFPGEKLTKKPVNKNRGKGSAVLAWIFFAVVGASVFYTELSLLLPIYYMVVSLVTFVFYAIDKWAALHNRWRTAERTLNLLALIGGWPGALIGQQVFRHKTQKESFRREFWGAVLLNCAAFVWVHTKDGRALLQEIVEAIL